MAMWSASRFLLLGGLSIWGLPGQTEVDPRCPTTALERGPSLLGSRDPLMEVVRAEGYIGRLSYRFTVTETGAVSDVVVTAPEELKNSAKVRSAIEALQYCPAVRFSRYASTKVNTIIEVR